MGWGARMLQFAGKPGESPVFSVYQVAFLTEPRAAPGRKPRRGRSAAEPRTGRRILGLARAKRARPGRAGAEFLRKNSVDNFRTVNYGEFRAPRLGQGQRAPAQVKREKAGSEA